MQYRRLSQSRYRSLGLAALLAALAIAGGSGERAAADGPSLAAGTGASSAAFALSTTNGALTSADSRSDWLDGAAVIHDVEPPAAPEIAPVPTDTVAPTPAATVAPVRIAAPPPVRTAPPPPPAAAPATCASTWFCYPRLGIAGPIVPYTDCSGGTDVGTAIRSYSCLSNNYLMGHAYTQFGLVRQWAAGDIVFAWGQRFTVTGAVTQQSCAAPSFPLASLSMQTSLTSSACGAVLVVQAR